jgi:hypothetical protein
MQPVRKTIIEKKLGRATSLIREANSDASTRRQGASYGESEPGESAGQPTDQTGGRLGGEGESGSMTIARNAPDA